MSDVKDKAMERIMDWYQNPDEFSKKILFEPIEHAIDAAKLPGDVYAGKVKPDSDEEIQRSLGLASLYYNPPRLTNKGFKSGLNMGTDETIERATEQSTEGLEQFNPETDKKELFL